MAFFETFVALRYLRAKRKKGFISLSTFISMAGVAVGVMALIIVIGVMTGFDQDLKRKILSINAHITIYKHGGGFTDYQKVASEVRAMPGVKEAQPFIFTQVMFSVPGNIWGGVLRGLDVDLLKKGGPPAVKLQQGSFKDLVAPAPDDVGPAAIGNELARTLNLTVGSRLSVISPLEKALTPMGRLPLPRIKPFRVVAIFHTGFYDFDSHLVYVSIPQAQEFLGLKNQVTGVEAEVNDIYAANDIGEAIQQKLRFPYFARDWMQMNRSLFSALKLEKITMFIILTLIVLVAALGIASTLFMIVMEKTRDIAILKSIGATRRSIMQIFVLEGMTIGMVGTILGLGGGLGLCALLKRYEFIKLPRDVYYISTLPVEIQVMDIVMIIGAAMAISLAATLYPAWQAARLDPVEAIRYE